MANPKRGEVWLVDIGLCGKSAPVFGFEHSRRR